MTFEEFFRKKRINLFAFEQGEPVLFSEFKIHFEQMGEKSFDHTKKYWFNKLRRQFVLAPEVKTGKPKIDNPLAEQTITEALDEMVAPPSLGFKPKFRASAIPKPAAEQAEETKPEISGAPAPKLGFIPKFKAAAPPKPEVEPAEEKPTSTEDTPTPPADAEAPKPAYKPRFNMKNIPKKEE